MFAAGDQQPTLTQLPDSSYPKLDLYESKDSNVTRATFELPGLTPSGVTGVTMELHNNRLTVSGEPVPSDAHEQGEYLTQERHRGGFSRTLELPLGTRLEDIRAKMENGLLTIMFLKTTSAQQPQRIAITSPQVDRRRIY